MAPRRLRLVGVVVSVLEGDGGAHLQDLPQTPIFQREAPDPPFTYYTLSHSAPLRTTSRTPLAVDPGQRFLAKKPFRVCREGTMRGGAFESTPAPLLPVHVASRADAAHAVRRHKEPSS